MSRYKDVDFVEDQQGGQCMAYIVFVGEGEEEGGVNVTLVYWDS